MTCRFNHELFLSIVVVFAFVSSCQGFTFLSRKFAGHIHTQPLSSSTLAVASSTSPLFFASNMTTTQGPAIKTNKKKTKSPPVELVQIVKTQSRKIENVFEEIPLEEEEKWSKPSRSPPQCIVYAASIITEAEVLAAHKAWGDGLVRISKTYEEQGYDEAKVVAQSFLDAAYGYAKGITVLFKPTLASGSQTFRLTNEGALSYFVGGNEKYPNDAGFAIMGWRKVDSYPAGILLMGETAISMGNVHCTDKNGKTTIVNKTWAYKKDDSGALRVTLHHSSLPYKPATTTITSNTLDEEEEITSNKKAPPSTKLFTLAGLKRVFGVALTAATVGNAILPGIN